jgi:T5SS/PEP-CTERM-associated repeat protein
VINSRGVIGQSTNAQSTAVVTGNGSHWINNGELIVGNTFGNGKLTISAGGRVSSTSSPFATSFFGAGVGAGFNSKGEVIVTDPGSQWTHNGSLIFGGDGTATVLITNGGKIASNGAVLGSGFSFSNANAATVTVTGPGSTWTNAGSLVVGSSRPATLTIADGGAVTSTSGAITDFSQSSGKVTVGGNGSSLNIDGTLTIGGGTFGGDTSAALEINEGGSVRVAGQTTIYPLGTFYAGQVKLQGGTFATSAIRFQLQTGNGFAWSAGTLHVGSYQGNLVNSAGILAPGENIGTTTVTGSYTQQSAGKLEIDIGGLIAGSEHDHLNVQGSAALAGELRLNLIDGFLPAPESIFTILSAGGNLTGALSNVVNGQRLATTDGTGSFLVHYGDGSTFNPKQVVLTNFQQAGLFGDYNNDGLVDAADYVLWRARSGANSTVDTQNYLDWRRSFGQSAAGAGSQSGGDAQHVPVPEPSALAFMIALTVGMSAAARIRNRTC